MRILTITALYPNAEFPNQAVFVENRLTRIVRTGEVAARVVAPVPWFPLKGRAFGRYGAYAAVPREETRHGLAIAHPRFLVVPKVGLDWQPASYLATIRPAARRAIREGFDFDLIDAHYLYPDGVAAAALARELGKPVVVTARGSDLNVIAELPGPGRQIRRTLQELDALIAVSSALAERARALGMREEKIAVLRNGVDTEIFRPDDGAKWRVGVPADAPVLLAVGNLIPLKGHDLVIRALKDLPRAHLLIAGQGEEEHTLRGLAGRAGLAGRVHFLGSVPHLQLAGVYSAADILVLASEREGWPNVLLEAMACGTPVVATRVGSVPEVITVPEAGRILEDRNPAAIARAVRALLDRPPGRDSVRAHARKFGWDDTVAKQIALYQRVIARARAERQD